ncbi:MAG: glycine/betaine/sarcosine/D-proline family reductase selenoprotein B [Actinobacteria bacterium]|jgi:betaine reductase|nr:MAG: glycine/betaine/sarcosine/D-proline family reductase selenoprotein B [Actinomycetota bacterium]
MTGPAVRIVHYVNQFFAGIGGEESAGTGPVRRDGPVGPGTRLAQLLGEGHEIVATVYCGDDYATTTPGAVEEITALIAEVEPDVVVAGPAFTSGRYGLACARVVAAAHEAGMATIACMHADNPGLDEAGGAPVVASGETARTMRTTLDALSPAVAKVAAGEVVTRADGRVGKAPRVNSLDERTSAERAVDLVLARLGGDNRATEVPLPRFDQVTPAAPVEDPSKALVAILTEGALVPDANPDGLESARATKWLRYPLDERDTMAAGEYRSVHGGFSTVWANEDPNRILPLDVVRELEGEGAIGRLHGEYLVTAGNGTSVGNARRFGVEWVGELRRLGVQAALLTAT